MADNPNVYKARERRARKDIPKAVRSPSEKVTAGSFSRGDAAPGGNADILEDAPEWSIENVPSQTAAVYTPATPAAGETRVIPLHTLPPTRGFEAAVVSSLVSLAKFARRKPGTSLALAAAAGLIAGLGVRRI